MAACKLKKGDRIYECKYHRSVLTELLADPVVEIQHDGVRFWKWTAKIVETGDVVEYGISEKNYQYGPYLYRKDYYQLGEDAAERVLPPFDTQEENMDMMNAFRIDGQRAVVTGGGSGLGFGIAKVFIEAGAEVIIIGRNEEKLRVAQQQLGERCSYRAFDVTQLEGIPALVKEIGAIDILVNCAGTHLKKWALDVSNGEFLDVMNVHVTSVFALSREFARLMVERGKGSIILISSMAALMGLEQIVAYTTAKTAVLGLQRSLVAELSPKGIRINTIAPGWIDTPMFHKATDADPQRKANILRRIPMKTFGQPEDIGYAALYLSSPAGSYVNGAFLPVDAGASEAF